tara:strand:+ start:15345 stop:15581 length:237 start_codon:yes stop_codon:yes gene_type:complete
MMQKLINVVALLSGLTSLAVVGGGVYVYMNQAAWQEQAKEKLAEVIADGIAGALPGVLDSAMPDTPEFPTTTGPALPF